MSAPRNRDIAVIHRTVSPTSAFELEKTFFCFRVGGVPWKRVLEGTKNAHRLKSWDSSAAEEAFRAAKRRFWEERNGLRPTARLPSPDLYTDLVDWDDVGQVVDQGLVLELEAAAPVDSYEDDDDDDVLRRCTRTRMTCTPPLPTWALLGSERVEPTGWDVEGDCCGVRTLEGMVVGD